MATNDTPGGFSPVQLRKAAQVALARCDLLGYAKCLNSQYETPPHIRLIAKALQRVESGECKRLIIIIPPRHGKTHLVSEQFFGWCLGRDPSRTCILTAYGASLAVRASTVLRETLRYASRYREIFPDVHIDPNRCNRDQWTLKGRTETIRATGVGGGITGFGAWLLLIDDPVADQEEADSPTRMEKKYEWYKNVARTRLMPGGRIVIISTRWAEDDLVGRILTSPEGDEYEILHLPALSYGLPEDYGHGVVSDQEYYEATRDIPKTCFPDPLGRHRDEALWPEWWPQEVLLEYREVMGHGFTTQYQGHPTAPRGNKFQRGWFREITPETVEKLKAEVVRQARSYDIAWTKSERADFTAGTRMSLYWFNPEGTDVPDDVRELREKLRMPPVFIVIEDIQKWQEEWGYSSDKIIRIAQNDGPDVTILVEAVAAQNSGFRSLRRDRRLWEHLVVPHRPNRSKLERAASTMRLARKGMIFVAQPQVAVSYPWADDLLGELVKFPHGATDDLVDTLTQFVNEYSSTITGYLNDVAEARAVLSSERVVRERLRPFELVEDEAEFLSVDRLGIFG